MRHAVKPRSWSIERDRASIPERACVELCHGAAHHGTANRSPMFTGLHVQLDGRSGQDGDVSISAPLVDTSTTDASCPSVTRARTIPCSAIRLDRLAARRSFRAAATGRSLTGTATLVFARSGRRCGRPAAYRCGRGCRGCRRWILSGVNVAMSLAPDRIRIWRRSSRIDGREREQGAEFDTGEAIAVARRRQSADRRRRECRPTGRRCGSRRHGVESRNPTANA